MSKDLAELLGTQETVSLEFKQSSKNRDGLGQVVCALANDLAKTGGGDLLVGVADNGTPVPGVDISDNELLTLTDFLRDSGRILDRPCLTVEVASFRGSPVIRVHVEASSTPPVRFKGIAWVRPGPTTREATRDDERVLSERRRALDGPYDTRPIHSAGLDDLDLSLFRSDYLPAVVAPEIIEENHRPLELQLASLRMATSDDVPTVVGVLVLGIDPSAHIPGAYVQFVRYQGVDLDAAVSDEQELRSNIVGSATRLAAVLRGHLHTRLTDHDGFREEQRPDYPFEALREVCMNAVMHRNYESSYAPVRIVWFDDRIEVTNPGGPYGQVREDNFDRVNDYRNPSLAAAMKSLGYVNRFGRGIGRIRAALDRNGNPPPEFTVDDSSWTVVLRRAT
ncbi:MULTISPECIES: ATP-binding protein [unclassified Crossiella]|uniref:ATP-binding protein n=1 Tax=unclassified Crossiella TaxID=2620835 RepID=UPI001FFF56DA|nr:MULTISPECIES: ATP-binding protein [unclassified Crossiella]MCK2242240.1 putative DNA binding domain-containing protein [Crossiella sp. S99.2]MCK2254729.1 putative DNA binding domain-containing protein [Crossiella sp. S99.1]